MPFVTKAIEDASKLETPSNGDGTKINLEVGQEVTVQVVAFTAMVKETKISKENNTKAPLVGYLSVKDPATGEEGVMSGFGNGVYGGQFISFFGLRAEDGTYTLKPELKDAVVRIGKIPVQSEKDGSKTYNTCGVEIISQPNKK